MHGNVTEWCHDWFGNDAPGEGKVDPEGATAGSARVYRGGSWAFDASLCRSAARDAFQPSLRSSILGFRLALVPSGQQAAQ